MILPTKHIRIAESIVGLGGILLSYISKKPSTIEELWSALQHAMKNELKGTYHNFDNLVLALDFLYITGAITLNSKGEIENATVETERK